MFFSLLLMLGQADTAAAENMALAERVSKSEKDWRHCMIAAAVLYAETSKDSASDIATASIESCRDKELDWAENLYEFDKVLGYSPAQAVAARERKIDKSKASMHQSLVYTVVDYRSRSKGQSE